MLEHSVQAKLSGATDLAGFRAEARQLLAHQVPPEEVEWHLMPEADSWGDPSNVAASRPRNVARAATAIVPASFMRLCEFVVLHRDPERFSLLYRLLWRLVHEPDLRSNPIDQDMLQAQHMAHAVRREIHKAKANLKFRLVPRPNGCDLHLACFEPAHHIVEAIAPWLARRMTVTCWAVFSPDRSIRWDEGRLLMGPAVPTDRLPAHDAADSAWLALYREVFEQPRPGELERRA